MVGSLVLLFIDHQTKLHPLIERYASSLFPFLPCSADIEGESPLSDLLLHHHQDSRGIVIPVGKNSFRFACHLLRSIRNVLNSQLPIEIAYAGEEDLPYAQRQFLYSLVPGVKLVDITTKFNDEVLSLTGAGWAIKPFAVLASEFQEVMLLDADAVLLQPPENIFDGHDGFKRTGTLLFHDRLLFKDLFPERHDWWEEQMKHLPPSENYFKSKVHMENYGEEGDSGLVMVDKGRLPVLMGLLHVAWQNSEVVRNEVTYVMGHGDKESWWFGFELCRVPYTFEDHYGSVLGQASREDGVDRVCSFTIAHTDEADRLLWFNGSLLKNKAHNASEYWVPDAWMTDGEWEKGMSPKMWSCQINGTLLSVEDETRSIIQASVVEAQKVDRAIWDAFSESS